MIWRTVILGVVAAGLVGCSSSAMRKKNQDRVKIAKEKGLFCDIVNGDAADGIEIELNLQMAQYCQADKSMTMSHFKDESGESQVLYCCTADTEALQKRFKKSKKMAPKKSMKKSAK